MIQRVGLTGGIGSGKSEVARILEQLGAYVIDADLLAREAIAPNSKGWAAIVEEWPQVLRDGAIDRSLLAEIVFSDPNQRKRLNEIVHPFVRKLAVEREEFVRPGHLIVHMAPLLFETGYGNLVEKTILVLAPKEERIRRVAARDGISERDVRNRMAAQIDPEAARERADYIIENDGDIKHLRERVQAVYNALQ